MMYAIDKDGFVRGTCKAVGTEELMAALENGCTWKTLDDAIKAGAKTSVGPNQNAWAWLGINFRVAIVNGMCSAWWLGKWRSLRQWDRKKTRPSDKWVQTQLEKTMRVNCPLHPTTIIKWHWEV